MMDEVLELQDEAAEGWFETQMAAPSRKRLAGRDFDPVAKRVCMPQDSENKMHLLLGCSIARASRLSSKGDDMLLNRARGGETWQRLSRTLPDHLASWRTAADAVGLSLGTVIFWLSGNDGYERGTGRNVFLDMRSEEERSLKNTISEVIDRAGTVTSSVVVLGTLPRLAHDLMLPWEHTAAYKLDRTTKDVKGPSTYITLGKTLTRKKGNKSRHLIVEECSAWFAQDGIHLSPEGYQKVSRGQNFSHWLVVPGGSA